MYPTKLKLHHPAAKPVPVGLYHIPFVSGFPTPCVDNSEPAAGQATKRVWEEPIGQAVLE